MEKIAYVDECGIDTYLHREYSYMRALNRLDSRTTVPSAQVRQT